MTEEELYRKVKNDVKSLFVNEINKINSNLDFDYLFEKSIETLSKKNIKLDNCDKKTLDVFYYNIQNKKKKWVDFEINNQESSYNKELQSVKFIFDKTKKRKQDTKILDCDNFKDYEKKLKLELENWKKDKNKMLISFPFIKNKKLLSIKSSFVSDISVFLIKELIKEKTLNDTPLFSETLTTLVRIPTDTTNKINLNTNNDVPNYVCEQKGNIFVYSIPEAENLYAAAGKMIGQVFKMFNSNDVALFDFILKNRQEKFFKSGGKITFFLKDACIELFGEDNTKNRNKIKASISKLSYLVIEFKQSNNERIKTALLTNDVIYTTNEFDNKKTTITVTIGDFYRNEILSGNLIRVYSQIIKDVNKNKRITKIVYMLQDERVSRYYARNKNILSNDYLYIKRDYSYFSDRIILNNKRVDRVIKSIEESLDIIVATKTIIQSYSREEHSFNIKFFPLTEEEINDLELSSLERSGTPLSLE